MFLLSFLIGIGKDDASVNGQIEFDLSETPTTGSDFASKWKKLASDEKRLKLLMITSQMDANIFHSDLPASVIMDTINLFISLNSYDDSKLIDLMHSVLTKFSQSQRFSLAMIFLSDAEKGQIKTLFEQIASCDSHSKFDQLKPFFVK